MAFDTESIRQPNSGLVFINTYGAGVTDAYRAAIISAETFLENHFVDQVTINADFEFASLGANFSANNNFNQTRVSYSALRNALQAHATTSDDLLAVANLPITDPSQGAGFSIPQVEARLLGLAAQPNANDVTVTLNSDLNWSFGQDAVGTVIHELTEGGFGRVGALNLDGGGFATMDLFRFTADGQRDFSGGSDGIPTFFGIAPTDISSFRLHNSVSVNGVNDGFDLADWDRTFNDAFGPGGANSPGQVSATDLQVLDVLGWTPNTGGNFQPAADDFANTLTDTSHPIGALISNGSVHGALQVAGDRDLFKLQTYPGFTYVISELGQKGNNGTLVDPFLRLDDANGAVIASNDDIVSGDNPNSQITYTPTTAGTVYAEAGSFVDGYAGSYTMTVTATINLPAAMATAISAVLRADPASDAAAATSSTIFEGLTNGTLSQTQAIADIVQGAQATSSVATLSYDFFTGSAPTAAGMDFLVSPTGGNANNLNSAYYQSFNLENRYINFAVNLGKLGAGEAAFNTKYGSLDLFDATRQAYTTIFGGTPSDTKIHALLDPTVVLNGVSMTRAQYFAIYGGDGPDGLGTKAAMVGWLMAEAEKADVGTFALSNDALLTDVATHNAPFGVDLVGVYNQPSFAFHPT